VFGGGADENAATRPEKAANARAAARARITRAPACREGEAR
jgi:hypothetical protein